MAFLLLWVPPKPAVIEFVAGTGFWDKSLAMKAKRSKTLGDWAVSAGMPGFLAGRELGFREA